MDSKWSTADVRLFKDVGGQGKKVQRADKDTETKISCEEGKHTAGKLTVYSFGEINFQEFLLTD